MKRPGGAVNAPGPDDTPGGVAMVKRSPAERFWVKVDKNGPVPERRPDLGPCWLWTAGVIGRPGNQYGQFWDGDRNVRAHRWAFENARGPLPEGLVPDHLCRVQTCVKAIPDERGPAHLEPVTHRENTLRGEGLTAKLAQQTRCKRGHEFTEANTYRRPDGGRVCRTCHRDMMRQRRHGEGWEPEPAPAHCANGHPRGEANTYWEPSGKRRCRACIRARGRRYDAKRRERQRRRRAA